MLFRSTRRISLGRKQLAPDPWTLVADKYKVGQRVRGAVVRVTDFGAFVQLEPGVDGLIHVSEMSWTRKQKKPSEILQPGETVEAVVLLVNAAGHRIALGDAPKYIHQDHRRLGLEHDPKGPGHLL